MRGQPLGELVLGEELQRAEPVARQVHRKLRQAIISRRLRPGERLREADVARALGVSRTPVREAIVRLVSDRLVRPLPGGGVEVVDTSRELEEIYFVREALEGYAARLAAERITPAELATLEEIVAASAGAPLDAFEERVSLNEQFHHVLSAASRVPRLIEMSREFREYSTNVQTLRLYDPQTSRQSIEEHREILGCLQDRDPDRVERAVRQHLRNAFRHTVFPQ
jgi:DNA-binding GntR family transcriptional regulator